MTAASIASSTSSVALDFWERSAQRFPGIFIAYYSIFLFYPIILTS